MAMERSLWQEPVESDAISARAKMSAAEEKARSLLADIRARGCNEDFIADPVKLVEGKVTPVVVSLENILITGNSVSHQNCSCSVATLSHALSLYVKIDFLPTKKMSAEDIAARKAERDAIAKASRSAMINVNGNEEEISVFFEGSYETNGGRMFDIIVGHDGRDTTHRVVIGKPLIL